MLWLGLHFLGVEPTTPTHMMTVSVDNLTVDMTYSHDLLPTIGWVLFAALLGRALFKHWAPALAGALLVILHAFTDYAAGFPHHVFGTESAVVGTGMYHSAPYTAVAIEGAFIAAVMGWVIWTDARRGLRRSAGTYGVWAGVFVGGTAFMFLTADLSLAELTGITPPPALDGTAVPFLAMNYALMILALYWSETRPLQSARA